MRLWDQWEHQVHLPSLSICSFAAGFPSEHRAWVFSAGLGPSKPVWFSCVQTLRAEVTGVGRMPGLLGGSWDPHSSSHYCSASSLHHWAISPASLCPPHPPLQVLCKGTGDNNRQKVYVTGLSPILPESKWSNFIALSQVSYSSSWSQTY